MSPESPGRQAPAAPTSAAPGQARSGLWQLALSGAAAGALAGFAAGLIDGLWSLGDTTQFLGSIPSQLAFLGFLAAGYAFTFGLLGVPTAWVLALYARYTPLGDLARAARAWHQRSQDPASPDGTLALALVLAAVPCVAGALYLAYALGGAALAERKHMGLIIAVAMILGLGAVLAGVLLALLLARPLQRALRPAARRPRLGPALRSPRLLGATLLLLLGLALALFAYAGRDTLALLRLRYAWVVLLVALFALVSTAAVGRRLASRLARERAPWRYGLPTLAFLLALALVIVLGHSDGVRKAANAYSGLGAYIPRPVRALVDLDRDGYSPLLGGGDCDDLDADVHPGAEEIPDDGIDQNCVGGDPSVARAPEPVAFAAVPPDVPADFNVVLVTIDTARADHLSAYGYSRPTTPSIDAVAADGALFVNAWAHAPSTRYSIPAILTGRYPLSVVYDTSIRGWPGLAPQNTTIAEVMKAAGMTTGALLNYWYFDPARHMDQGFDHYDNSNQRLHKQVPGEGPAQTKGSSSKEQTDAALAFVAEHADERFFLWVHYYDPHFQYERHPGTPSFGDQPIDLYDHELRFTDHHIGRLVRDLQRRGLYERTVIVITGDHGEGFGEHGVDLHGYHLYAAQTKVPLIVRVPGLTPRRVTTPVGHIDILPTLANLVGAAPEPMMMGRSLVAAMTGAEPPDQDRYVFQQLSYENNNEMRGAAGQACHAIYNVSPDTSWELYALDQDPQETRDIVDQPTDPCREARRALEQWYDHSELPVGAAAALLDTRPAGIRDLGLDLGDSVRLLDVQLPDQPLQPGQPFEVIYTFEARGSLPGGWRVFAHFEGPRGQRFLGDHEPPRPFSWWRAGQHVRYARPVTVPRTATPGRYDLWVGLFRGADRQPIRGASVPTQDDRALVGTVQVQR